MSFIDPFNACLLAMTALAILGLPIGYSMIGGSIVYLLMQGQDVSIAAEQLLQGLRGSFVLLAIPLFILSAELMNIGSLSGRLLDFCNAFVGRFRGGLGHVNVVQSVIFAGMSGSAIADAAGVGRLIIGMMTRDGRYSPSYAGAITAASAVIGPIIPPSIPMVLFSLVSDTSIGYLFLGGAVPGLLMAAMLMAINSVMARRRGFPVEEPVPVRRLPLITFRAIPALMMPVILLGGIYGGVTTPTEAAAVAALYAFLISALFYRELSVRDVYRAVLSSARSSASIGLMIGGSLVFNYVVTSENIPATLSASIAGYELSPIGFLLLVNVVLLVLGCLLEGITILLVIVPIFVPTAQALGIDMVHFGVVVVVNLMIGLITPPYGLLLFVVANLARVGLLPLIRDVLPFLLALLAALAFVTLVPDSVLWLPRLLGYNG
ncbi:Neu5Ac permease [Hartmannibacter diazotrophicus]|uniref:TRAP transporter large permease protein n=1 Tax=Hartmannibacter diazotrophicus TaxID=1482074 RepID=A0A2C9D682_9HYPH|nr:TRAP transporter large permease [Hartmannibacter diazotrophicus]SON55679.1 Neu5Ac permease [Hartmannibacter diazotrophicus]